jgi:hypothetical protein
MAYDPRKEVREDVAMETRFQIGMWTFVLIGMAYYLIQQFM